MIAMALAAGPRMLIADEPTTALDVTVQKQILELLATLAPRTAVFRCFSSRTTSAWSRRLPTASLVMYAGRIVEEGPTEEVLRRAASSLHGGFAARGSAPVAPETRADSGNGARTRRASARLLVRAALRALHFRLRRRSSGASRAWKKSMTRVVFLYRKFVAGT